MTEKIRQLTNKVHLAGAVVELSNIIEGSTKNNIPYISFSGVIQCGESQVNRVRFRTFVKSKKADGSDSKNFTTVKNWAKKCIPMDQDEENCTYVDAIGSLTDHPYVNKEGTLVEATEFNLQFFSDFTDYAADIDVEGFIHSIKDETKNGDSEETTGRQRMRLITRDIFGNTVDLKNIIIPEDLVEPVADNGYEKGSTAKFFLSLLPNKKVVAKTGGIGTQRVDGGKPYLEWIMTGADSVIDPESEQALDVKVIKAAMVERQSRLDEIKEAGYQGNKASDAGVATGAARSGLGTKSSKEKAEEIMSDIDIDIDIDDDDIPF